MNKPLISVIIAIYNAEKWISRMIDSVLNQSLKDFELLLVDDGSNDGTADILDDYAQKDDRITLLHKVIRALQVDRYLNNYDKVLALTGDSEEWRPLSEILTTDQWCTLIYKLSKLWTTEEEKDLTTLFPH